MQYIYIYIYIYIIYIYGIHHWRIIWSSYRMLVWMGLQPTTTELGSDALTDWASTPWAQLAPRANFAQLLQFHYLFIVQFHFGYCRLSSYCLWHIYFNWNFLEVTSKCSYNFTVVVSTSIQTNSLKFQINFQSLKILSMSFAEKNNKV